MGGHPEAGRDVLDVDAALVQPMERLELVGRGMSWRTMFSARLASDPSTPFGSSTRQGTGVPLVIRFCLPQQSHGGRPAPAGDDLVAVARLPLAVKFRPDQKGLQQPMRLDGGGQGFDARSRCQRRSKTDPPLGVRPPRVDRIKLAFSQSAGRVDPRTESGSGNLARNVIASYFRPAR